MVQTDISQLAAECKEWRQILRNYRDEFQESRRALTDMFQQDLSKSGLQQVEHFDNQFYIQTINIHDTKQAIKAHERKMEMEPGGDDHTTHEKLLDEFLRLESTLQELRSDFQGFINDTSC